MAVVKRVVDIKAPPEKVFDLIARVEDFSNYSDFIKQIKATAPATYHWIVDIYGLELEWDAKVVEAIKPKKFVWQSVKGIQNSGSYNLEPIEGGTRVVFSIEYHLTNAVVERLTEIFTDTFMEKMTFEMLEKVRKKLEKS